MTHLHPSEFVEALEATLAPRRQTHLDRCARCQAELQAMRATLHRVEGGGEVPEPSPLFWDQFGARVRAAVETEPRPRAWRGGLAVAWWQVTAIGAALACLLAVVIWRGRAAPAVSAPAAPTVATIASSESGDALPALTGEDESIDVVAAVAGPLSWDEAKAANLTPKRYAVDVAMQQLSEAQRRELIRLVQAELKGTE
jgi:hypothetical protein